MDIQILKYDAHRPETPEAWKAMSEEIREYEYPLVFIAAHETVEVLLTDAWQLAAGGNPEKAAQRMNELQSHYQHLIRQVLETGKHPKNELIRESSFAKIEQSVVRVQTFFKYAAKAGALNIGIKDAITSTGIQLAAYLLAQCGLSHNLMTHYVDAGKLIKTDRNYGNASPDLALIRQKIGSLETVLNDGFTPVIGYSYGAAPDDTLTRINSQNSDLAIGYIRETLQST